ncbi:hypothetical protein ACSA002_0440 [Salmonella phage vB_SalM_SA002]|nr:hypothetical protein ACSA002_0440 [Salmonella phage vB_SalM_SA002]
MTHPLLVGTPDPETLRRLAAVLESQTSMSDSERIAIDKLNRCTTAVEQSAAKLNELWTNHLAILAELELLGVELSEQFLEDERHQTVTGSIVIDNVIVEIEVQFQILTRNGNATRAINAISIKRDKERVDIVSQNSKTLVVYEDQELIMDVAINTLTGATADDALRFVMSSIERWTLEHRHDNHFDLVIKLLIKCKVIVHPEEKVVNPTPAPVVEPVNTGLTRAHHTREYIPHGTTFWRDGHWRTSSRGNRYWVEGHWVTR